MACEWLSATKLPSLLSTSLDNLEMIQTFLGEIEESLVHRQATVDLVRQKISTLNAISKQLHDEVLSLTVKQTPKLRFWKESAKGSTADLTASDQVLSCQYSTISIACTTHYACGDITWRVQVVKPPNSGTFAVGVHWEPSSSCVSADDEKFCGISLTGSSLDRYNAGTRASVSGNWPVQKDQVIEIRLDCLKRLLSFSSPNWASTTSIRLPTPKYWYPYFILYSGSIRLV